jgi:hypothetical protein
MKTLVSRILSNANNEFLEESTLSENTLNKVFMIYRSQSPKNWHFGNSNKKKAYRLIRKVYSPVIKRWGYSFSKRNGDLSDKEKNIKKNSYIFEAINEVANTSPGILNREEFLIKNLYANFGKYSLFSEVEGETVDLIKGIKEGSEVALKKLIEKKKNYLMSKIKYRISWRDKESIVSKAIFDASNKALFVGGFNKYLDFHVQSELKKYFSEFPSDKLAFMGERIEKEFADVDSIKLFDKDSYETLLEQSEIANRGQFIPVEEVPIPKKLLSRFEKLILSEGKSLSPYMDGFIQGVRVGPLGKISNDELKELFVDKYSGVKRNIVEDKIGEFLEKYGRYIEEKEAHGLFDPDDWSGEFQIFLKEKEELEKKEFEKRDSETKLKKHDKRYLHLVARTLEDVGKDISYYNFGIYENEEEKILDLKGAGMEVSDYFVGFENMPFEFRKEALISKISGNEFFGEKAVKRYCLNQEDLNSLKEIALPSKILGDLYGEGIVLQEKISEDVYRAAILTKGENSLEKQVVVFNNHPLVKESKANLKNKSHNLLESFCFEGYSCVLLSKKKTESLNLPGIVTVSEDFERIIENLNGLESDVLKFLEGYRVNGIPVPRELVENNIISRHLPKFVLNFSKQENLEENKEWMIVPKSFYSPEESEKLIIIPNSFYVTSFDDSMVASDKIKHFFSWKRKVLENSYENSRKKDYDWTLKMLGRLDCFWPEYKDPDEPSINQLMSKYDEWGGKRIREIGDILEEDRKRREREGSKKFVQENFVSSSSEVDDSEEDIPF